MSGFQNQKSSCNWKRWYIVASKRFFLSQIWKKMSSFTFPSLTQFQAWKLFFIGHTARGPGIYLDPRLVSNTHFRLFFVCFTAKHFISYHWKAIRRYSIWRSEGLATSYIAVKLGYRMWQLPEIYAKIMRIKKKVFLDAHFSYYSYVSSYL